MSTETAGLQAVDTHVHLWDTRRFRYPWLKDLPKLDRPFLPADYRLAVESLPITKMVFMQCETDPAQSLEEARWAAGLARSKPRLKGLVPWAPLEAGAAEARPIWRSSRHSPWSRVSAGSSSPNRTRVLPEPRLHSGRPALPEHRWSFDLCISHGQLKNTIQLVQHCPRVSFVLDHIGKPAIRSRLRSPWEAERASWPACRTWPAKCPVW